MACPVIVLLGGCAATTVVHDYSAFSSSYARDMNWQMLTNLARLDQGHPPYFVAIGEFKMNRAHTVGLAFDRTHSNAITDVTTSVPPSHTIVNTLSRVWKPSATTQVTPQLSFIPMNSEETAKQLLQPVPVELFLLLYQQGWRIDHLLRVLVDRIEFKDGSFYNNGVVGGQAESYGQFLRYAEIMRTLQEKRQLKIQSTEPSTQTFGSRVEVAPTAKDINDAAAQGRIWRSVTVDNKTLWELVVVRTNAQLVPTTEEAIKELSAIQTKPPAGGAAMRITAYGLVSSSGVDPTQEASLVLRSFRSILEGLATEQQSWLSGTLITLEAIPVRQQRPILRFLEHSAAPKEKDDAEAVRVTYGGRSYRIVDHGAPDARWNRDVFRLVTQLSSQVTVDISKFQRTVLQIGP